MRIIAVGNPQNLCNKLRSGRSGAMNLGPGSGALCLEPKAPNGMQALGGASRPFCLGDSAMRNDGFASMKRLGAGMAVASIALLCGTYFAGYVLAQTRGSAAVRPSALPLAQAAAQQSTPGPVASDSTLPDPALDEGTAQRIA